MCISINNITHTRVDIKYVFTWIYQLLDLHACYDIISPFVIGMSWLPNTEHKYFKTNTSLNYNTPIMLKKIFLFLVFIGNRFKIETNRILMLFQITFNSITIIIWIMIRQKKNDTNLTFIKSRMPSQRVPEPQAMARLKIL